MLNIILIIEFAVSYKYVELDKEYCMIIGSKLCRGAFPWTFSNFIGDFDTIMSHKWNINGDIFNSAIVRYECRIIIANGVT